ncbi:unnamed protein product, partial [Rotaria sp. Silwood1]
AGDSLAKILKIQLINSVGKLLNTPDIFAFFQYDSEETDAIKRESCFKSKTGQFIVKPGIQSSFSYFINLLNKALKQKQELAPNENTENYSNYITDEFLDNHSLLKSLIKWYRLNDLNGVKQTNQFLVSFIDNLINNCTQSPNNFRHSESIKNFAICLYVLGGKQTYEFIRLNLYGSIPNLTTLGELIKNSDTAFSEAEFNFESLRQCHSQFGFCSEDTTGIIRKVEYDSKTNSFVGFVTPIDHGIPLPKFYQANTFNELKTIYETNEIASLLNVHMFQSIPTEDNATRIPRPLLLSAYGVDNKITAINVLNRWMYIFQHCLDQNVRIIGFSTDADRRYVSAMRLASGFFASLPDLQLDKHQHAFKINVPTHWKWFFLRNNQLFLFFQDPVHLVTKWRNRLLSTTTDLRFGTDKITITHIEALISNDHYTKLDHGLTSSDINPKDRQNYNSCIKLISDDVINLLINGVDTNGTVVYLTLLKMIVKAYIDKSTSVRERVQLAWCVVFVCRIWWSWLKINSFSSSSRSKATTEKTNNSSKMFGYSSRATTDNNEELESDDDGVDEDENASSDDEDELYDELLNFENDDYNEQEEILNSTRSSFDGIKIVDNINPTLKHSYFKIKINDKIKYLHKQSACWLLSNKSTRLSSDRLSRVMQQTTHISS